MVVYVLDELTYNKLHWVSDNEIYKGTTKRANGHGEGMRDVLKALTKVEAKPKEEKDEKA